MWLAKPLLLSSLKDRETCNILFNLKQSTLKSISKHSGFVDILSKVHGNILFCFNRNIVTQHSEISLFWGPVCGARWPTWTRPRSSRMNQPTKPWCVFFNFWTLWMKLCTRLLFGRTNMQTERDTHPNANEIKLKKHETHHCHDSQMEHELRTLLLMTFEMHICLQFRSGSQRHPFWHRWIHHWVDTIWPSPDPWSCAVNVWKLGGQHELVKLCKNHMRVS